MRSASRVGVLIAAAFLSVPVAGAQTPGAIARDVIACTAWPCTPEQDLSGGEAILEEYRATRGTTSEALEALSRRGLSRPTGAHARPAAREGGPAVLLGALVSGLQGAGAHPREHIRSPDLRLLPRV
jgi:hypothetical protein